MTSPPPPASPLLPAQVPLRSQFTFQADLGVGGKEGTEEGRLDWMIATASGRVGVKAWRSPRLCHCRRGLPDTPRCSGPQSTYPRTGAVWRGRDLCDPAMPAGSVGNFKKLREGDGLGQPRAQGGRGARAGSESAGRPRGRCAGLRAGGGDASGAGLPGGLAGGRACVSAASPGVFH